MITFLASVPMWWEAKHGNTGIYGFCLGRQPVSPISRRKNQKRGIGTPLEFE
jgi:hypothetical protein